MIKELLLTLLPSIIILFFVYCCSIFIKGVEKKVVLKSFLLGMLIILPALLTMEIVGILLTITIPYVIPVIIFQVLSALNEEGFKFLIISKLIKKPNRTYYSVFVGGGFALTETVYLAIGSPETAIIRAMTTLPLHILTSVLLSKGIYKRRYLLLALLIHISFNLLIH